MSAKRTLKANPDSFDSNGSTDDALEAAGVALQDRASAEAGGVVSPKRRVSHPSALTASVAARAGAATSTQKATAKDHLAALETREPAVAKRIVIPALDIRTLHVRLTGDASLIVHRFSEKSKKMMLDKQMGVATGGREFKDPQQDFEDSLYRLPGGKFGFPAIAFKSACVSACTSLGKTITKVAARQSFHVVGDMIEIQGIPSMREDCVRIGQGIADLRYRGEFRQWSCRLTIRYNARVISDEQLVNLLNVAGFAVGVGEWRVERDGQFGLFHVDLGDA